MPRNFPTLTQSGYNRYMKLNILLASDQDSYRTLWLNGIKVRESSDSIYLEDILYMIEDFVNENGSITDMNVEAYDLYETNTSEIPEEINTGEELCSWYLETTGEELE